MSIPTSRMIALVCSLNFVVGAASVRAEEPRRPVPPPSLQRLLDAYADPTTDEKVGEVLVKELGKLPPSEQDRYDDLLQEALEWRRGPKTYPRAFPLLRDIRGIPARVLSCLETQLSAEARRSDADYAPDEEFFFTENCTTVIKELDLLSTAKRQHLRDRLVEVLPSQPGAVRMRLIRVLRASGEVGAVWEPLLRDVASSDEEQRFQACVQLGWSVHATGSSSAPDLTRLRGALADKSPRVRCAALMTLAETRQRMFLPDLRRLLHDFAPFLWRPGREPAEPQRPSTVAGCALGSLARSAGSESVGELISGLADSRTAEDACDALRVVDPPGAPHSCEAISWGAWRRDGGQ